MGSKRLGNLHKYFMGKEHEGAHDALADCIAIERLLLHERFQGHWRRVAKDCMVTMGPNYTQYKGHQKLRSPIDTSLEQLSKQPPKVNSKKDRSNRLSQKREEQSSSTALLKRTSKQYSTIAPSSSSDDQKKNGTKTTSTTTDSMIPEVFLDFDSDGKVSPKDKQDLQEKMKNLSISKSK